MDRHARSISFAKLREFALPLVLSIHPMQVRSSPEFTALRKEGDQQRRFARETELLQRELPAKLFANIDLRKAAIEAVTKLSDDVGLTLKVGASPQ